MWNYGGIRWNSWNFPFWIPFTQMARGGGGVRSDGVEVRRGWVTGMARKRRLERVEAFVRSQAE